MAFSGTEKNDGDFLSHSLDEKEVPILKSQFCLVFLIVTFILQFRFFFLTTQKSELQKLGIVRKKLSII